MGRELHNPTGLHPAPGLGRVTVATGTQTIYFAGQVALDKEFNIVGEATLAPQQSRRCRTSRQRWVRSA